MSLLEALTRQQLDCFSDDMLIARMAMIEVRLAKVQAELDIIPVAAADEIAATLPKVTIASSDVFEGMRASGVPLPALLKLWRQALSEDAASYLHWGATSQDILDTAMICGLRDCLDDLQCQIIQLGDQLTKQMLAERHTICLAHTRFQQAVPTTLGLRFASWLVPLERFLERFSQARPRVLMVQFGGAAGNLSALGTEGLAVASALARELNLGEPLMPWHNQRDCLFELSAITAGLSGHLGKIGQDILLSAQNEVGEMREAQGGSSSTMPHKSNPVRAEALVTIARQAGSSLGNMHSALLHAQERDGAAWALEWQALPALFEGTATALSLANDLVSTLEINHRQMAENLQSSGGAAFAEALSFVLAQDRPRGQAQKLVKSAIAATQSSGGSLRENAQKMSQKTIDPDAVHKMATDLPAGQAMIDAVAAHWHSTKDSLQ